MNKKIYEYTVIRNSNDFVLFNELVEKYLNNGWKCVGGVNQMAIGDSIYISQAVTRERDEEQEEE